jgi:N,N'-diacetyllegionaminate synthase
LRTLIIAEAGVNHNGDMNLAHDLIDVAAASGADMVKFQTFKADKLATNNAKKADYQIELTNASESQHAMLNRLELDYSKHQELITHCQSKGIAFFSTGFDIDSIDLLIGLGLDFLKIPSGEITNLPLLRHIASYRKNVILSTGMSDMSDINEALGVLEMSGLTRDFITILHCNTAYPTPMLDVNLRAMLTIGKKFGVKFGYSDHTLGIEVPVAAVALGASVIEKHFTLSRDLDGPDHRASLEPNELKNMVTSIRNIEQALGDGIKKVSSSEIKNKTISRKSLVAACGIKKGDVFGESNLVVKRPGTGLSPMLWDEVIGSIAIRDFVIDELIEI